MPNCCVFGCGTTSKTKDAKLFTFPKLMFLLMEEVKSVGKFQRDDCRAGWRCSTKKTVEQCKNLKICNLHFISGVKPKLMDKENPDWIPSQNLHDHQEFFGVPNFEDEMNETYDPENLIPELYALETDDVSDVDEVGIGHSELFETHRSIASQTDVQVTGLSAQLILPYEQKIAFLEEKLSRNETRLKNYEGNDAKTCFFTGLTSFITMKELFLTLEPDLPETSPKREHQLTKFQVFLMVLYRMRLNVSFRYLAYKFEVSPQTISKYFYDGLLVMYSRLRSLVYLPSREDIKRTMPLSFKERFGDQITIIIDCFEVFIERSSLPKALAQTFSFYKHHNTLKFLIGITPQGMISFISEGYGGRSSDKFVTETCGFLQCLEEGMADIGFLIEDSLKHLGVRAEIPAFTKGQNQLHPYELEKTRKIANLRIEVEQVIGLLRKKYLIFSQRLFPISTIRRSTNKCDVSAVDQMLIVCSALVNLCGPICVRENNN